MTHLATKSTNSAVRRIAKKVNGMANLGRICGVHPSQPSHWDRPTDQRNGRGGSIPDRYHGRIIAYCREQGIPLRKGELVNG